MTDNEPNETLSAKEEPTTEENPYAYLERDFSSENFKIEVKNLPKFYGMHELRKLLNTKLNLNSNKIKTTRRNSPYAFVCFRNGDDRDKALQILSGYKWKGSELQAIKAKPAPDPLVKKRNADAETENSNKKAKLDGVSQEEKLKCSTIPYWNVKYEEQLERKQSDISNVLRKLASELAHFNPELRQWISKQKRQYDGLPCELENIKFAAQSEGYRNKCEFSIGINEETNLPTVGFRIGSYVNGITGVGSVENLIHIPKSMKIAVKLFEDYVRRSDLKVFSPEFQTGHFRQLTIRTATNQLMLIVGIHPQDLSEEKLVEFKSSIVTFFTTDEGKEANVTSLYYQKIVKKNHKDDVVPAEHLWGETHIHETILDLKFRISPEAFFQINTKGAEILYNSAIELAQPIDKSTVLDVCCGTGTIGLCFAKTCTQVLGLEVVPQAIIDAKENASINNIENADFYTGKAEDILGTVCFKSKENEVIAIIDPPRAGLHQKAILQVRKIPKIKKIVYVSCNPSAALKNFVDLGRPESKTVHGDPFVPVKAIPVDMFPYTKHCELVICFERWEKVKKEFKEEMEASQVIDDANKEAVVL